MKTITKPRAVRAIVSCMCRYGHMNGWLGDTSKEFRTDQVNMFLDLSRKEQVEWLARNHFNITKYCRVPQRIINAAL